jgi:hypothetical protein
MHGNSKIRNKNLILVKVWRAEFSSNCVCCTGTVTLHIYVYICVCVCVCVCVCFLNALLFHFSQSAFMSSSYNPVSPVAMLATVPAGLAEIPRHI